MRQLQSRLQRHSASGFTLVELMIAVAIVTVLVTISVIAYSRYMHRNRIMEAHDMLGQIRAKQLMYFEGNGDYAAASADCTAWYPTLLTSGEPVAKTWNPTSAGWVALSVQPASRQAFFSYRVVAGAAPAYTPDCGADTRGSIPTNGQPWFFAMARGDLDGKPATGYTELSTSSFRPAVVVTNEGR